MAKKILTLPQKQMLDTARACTRSKFGGVCPVSAADRRVIGNLVRAGLLVYVDDGICEADDAERPIYAPTQKGLRVLHAAEGL